MADLYDLGANDAHADDLTSLGSPGAGSYSNDPGTPGATFKYENGKLIPTK